MNASQAPLNELLEDEQEDPARDHQVAEPAADVCRDPGRPGEVLLRAPEGGAQHAPAVERQRRQQVEGEQEQVQVPEPRGDAVDGVGQVGRPGDERERQAEGERDERAGDRDPELGAGTLEHPAELRHAPEQPQRDPVDLHPLVLGLERVPELVREQGGEEEHGADHRHRQVRAVREPGVLRREDRGRPRPHDQREDDEPAPVDPDADPPDREQLEARAHGWSVAPGASGRAARIPACPHT